jgi:hypothetical protein
MLCRKYDSRESQGLRASIRALYGVSGINVAPLRG